jgi:hypothetical protein
MTLQERERELQALELDAESVGAFISEIDTPRLYLLAEAIKLELTDRYEGKPIDKLKLH